MTQLSNAPVVYVLSQVRFSPVLKMSDFIPDIQEKHRKKYPVFEEQTSQVLKIGPAGPQASTETRWYLANPTQDTGFVITPGFVAFMTLHYSSFDNFLDQFRTVLVSLKEIADVSLVNRIGLRYIDFIEAGHGLQLDDLVRREYFGFRMSGVDRVTHQQDTSCITSAGKMRMRLMRGNHSSVLPDDLDPVLRIRAAPENVESIILDTDHFDETESEFDIERICDVTDSLHLQTSKAFQAVVTEEALEAWA